MKKFLCLMLAFLLCTMNCLGSLADENIKSNESEGNSSTTLTYGPLTFDTHGEWIASRLANEGNFIHDALLSVYDSNYFVGFVVQDVWNIIMPEETRQRLEAEGITQADYHNLEMARAYLADYATKVGVDANNIETLKIGDYYYAYIVAPFSLDYTSGILTYNAPTYYTLMKGYLIKFFLMAPENSAYHDSFLDMLSTMSISIVDSLR